MAEKLFLNKREIGELVKELVRAQVEVESPLESTQSEEVSQYNKTRRKFFSEVEKPLLLDYLHYVIKVLETKSTLRRDELEPLLMTALEDTKTAYVARTTRQQRAEDEKKFVAAVEAEGDIKLLGAIEELRKHKQPPLALNLYENHRYVLKGLDSRFQEIIQERSTGPGKG
jgi:hypothetical protein